ncbi:MAG: hypothetical protein DRI34_09435 [Deltaproteobacteria bacterium]|nr:MAG: hypothetical protein DRI34_09435 [Deltaproteobacteria bacterium]
MAKLKSIFIVIVVVAAGTLGAIIGLNRLQQQRMEEESRLLEGTGLVVSNLVRSQQFQAIQRLAAHSHDDELVPLLDKLPAVERSSKPEVVRQALAPAHQQLLPLLEKLARSLSLENLAAVSGDGLVVAQSGTGDAYGQNWRGLPVVAECLQGYGRDGWYEMNDQPTSMVFVPVWNGSGKIVGCLGSLTPLNAATLSRWSKPLGLEAALFSGKHLRTVTLSDATSLREVLQEGTVGEQKLSFVGKNQHVPWLFPQQAAFAVFTVKLPGQSANLQLALVKPLEPWLQPLLKAQRNIFLGAGALFLVGLLLALVLSGSKTDKQLNRLLDSVKVLSEGGSSSLDVNEFSGVVAQLAIDIKSLAERNGVRPPMANGVSATAAAVSDFSPSTPPAAPAEEQAPPPAATAADSAPSTLDFESLLGEASQPESAPAKPAEPAASSEPAPEPEPAEAPPAAEIPPPPAPAAAGGGPRVDVPGDLASIFGEGDDTREFDASFQPQAAMEEAARQDIPPPPPVAPAQPATVQATDTLPPDLDEGDEDEISSSDYRPDATVIAEVPSELISLAQKASPETPQGGGVREIPPPPSPIPAPPVVSSPSIPPPPVSPAADADPLEKHFQEVFERFLETKKQCGESTSGLSYEKFAQKLRKNTADLKARYQCRTVKFQVYVKNGKAALKATPIK